MEVWRGSEADLELSRDTVSTFESTDSPKWWGVNFTLEKADQGKVFLVEDQPEDDSGNYYEEPDSPRGKHQLTPDPTLKDITNVKIPRGEPPKKVENLDDLTEPSVAELEEMCGVSLEDDRETHRCAAENYIILNRC